MFSDDNIIRSIKMQVVNILSKHLSKVMHKTRLTTLSLLVESLFHAKFFNLTGLGRALKTNAQERSSIRRVDRFLGNKNIQKDRIEIYKTVCKLFYKFQFDLFVYFCYLETDQRALWSFSLGHLFLMRDQDLLN